MNYLSNLYQLCTATPGGVPAIEFAPIEYFKEYIILPLPSLENPHEPIFKDFCDWIQASFIKQKNKAEADYAEKQTNNNNVYNISIPATLPNTDQGTESTLVAMAQSRYIVRVWMSDGTCQVFGSLEQPLTFTFDKKSGSELKTFTGYNILFSGVQSTPPFYYY